MITGYGLQAINVTDTRHWSTLPAQTYMARMGLPIGPTVLKYTLPSGVTLSQTVNLVGGYNVVYIRMFKNRATVLTSNDPAALPAKAVIAPIQAAPLPVVQSPVEMIPAPVEAPQEAPLPVSALNSEALVPASNPTTPPAGGNMEVVKPYEPPNLLNSLQQLFN